ncbi:bis(5'-nucleosyl)-tetraphosphatase [asymmetrical] [Chrysoperla carnea]|uniref:bis(5'-nucleosyl)-tetraphosphatase [asymmetrical] n=1 Tax=Chrysoperla carnea TaxID=189513 RepID=UPI001D07E34D|nr:bis(5'-nucleosyl)-tetraphosphatase [asymmetrical] [Chrysoperla carnea]
MATKRACGFVIFRKQCQIIEYLLLQTSYGINHWTPPKGHVDPGESDMTTALRETYEEAGLKQEDLKIYEDCQKILNYDVQTKSGKTKPKAVIYWLAELINPNQKVTLSDEHQDFKWLGLNDACEYGKFEEMKSLLKEFDEYIKKNLFM